jgi:hypothetical protein
MAKDTKLSPGQWTPWISDPDLPEPSMTEEPTAPALRSSNPPEQTVAERKAEMMALILRNHPGLTREDVQGLLDAFF